LQLRDGSFGATVTSMAANEARVALRAPGGGAARSMRLVDLPGHPRLRGLLDDAAPSARCLVFLVDGRDGVFLPAARETAECVLRSFFAFHRLFVGFPSPLFLRSHRAPLAMQAAAGRADAPGAGAPPAAAAARRQQDGPRVRSPLAGAGRLASASQPAPLRRAGCHSVHFVRKRLEKEMCAPLRSSRALLQRGD